MKEQQTLGVVVGRFQVPELHAGHCYLIATAEQENDGVLVVLGITGGFPDRRNPLPYDVRVAMVHGVFPRVEVVSLADASTNEMWSENLDALIASRAVGRSVTLYASRDGFTPCYFGRYPVKVLPEISGVPSGTDMRADIGENGVPATHEFRAGMIAAQSLRLGISYQTVDIAVIRYETSEVLVGRKAKDGGKWRFIGGFVDPKDESLEAAAARELHEEAGDTLITHELHYLGSYRIEDARYRSGEDRLITALFATYLMGGRIQAGDDMDEVLWIPVGELALSIVPQHKALAERVAEFVMRHQAVNTQPQ